MRNNQADWVFNLVLKFAVVMCLCTLAIGLVVGTGPLTALVRSGTAFTVFALLGWATSLVWQVPEVQETKKGTANQPKHTPENDSQESTVDEQPPNDEPPTPADQEQQ
jgi:hypothetical protein